MTLYQLRSQVLKAEQTRTPMGPISDLVPGGLSIPDAFTIAEAGISERLSSGRRIVGYKVGFTNLAVREKMGLPDSTYGTLLDDMVMHSGQPGCMSQLIAPKIECEILFRIGKPLSGPDLSVEQVLDATNGVRAAFEICDARIKDWKCPYPDFLADNGFSARIVLGESTWLAPSALDLLAEEVVLFENGEEVSRGQGKNAMGHPAQAVAWLAGKLAARGRALLPGDIVMTGTLTPILPIKPGASYRASYTTLGEVGMTF